MKPAFAKPHPARPELVLLCDVSGSVSGFSGFTMLLVQALSDQFSKVRVFAFVNAMDEVTDIVKDTSGDLGPRIAQEARITKWHTSSDYGEAFGDFAESFMNAVGPRTSVLILGDARNNNQDPNLGALHADRPARAPHLLAEPRAPHALGPGRLDRAGLRRGRRDARVLQRRPAEPVHHPPAAGLTALAMRWRALSVPP